MNKSMSSEAHVLVVPFKVTFHKFYSQNWLHPGSCIHPVPLVSGPPLQSSSAVLPVHGSPLTCTGYAIPHPGSGCPPGSEFLKNTNTVVNFY